MAEIAPPAIRGRLIGLYELCWQIGGVVGFWINYGVAKHIPSSHKQWVIAFAVQLIVSFDRQIYLYHTSYISICQPGGLLLIGSLFLKESPRWLVSRDRNASAMASLSSIRNLPPTHLYVMEEMASIKVAIEHERSLAGAGFLGPVKTVFASKRLTMRLLLGSSMFAWQNATGINAINYYSYVSLYFLIQFSNIFVYSPTIFKSIGVTGQNSSLLTTGVYGIIKLVGALVWLWYLVDQFGRRAVLMIGSLGGKSMYCLSEFTF